MPFIGNKPSAVPLTSADIADGIITSAKIVDATIANADIANSTINLTTKVTGTLPVANGGTGLTALGTSLQVLRTNTGATALEYATLSTGATAGQVIQVVGATDSTQRSTTSSSFTASGTTLSLSITPSSASNKIFIIVGAVGRQQYEAYYTVFRGATDLGAASSKGLSVIFGEGGVASVTAGIGISFLDSPATTSATTYEVRFRVEASTGTSYLNYNNVKGSITLMEIKG
jgi:hypothetical protein